MQKKQLKSEEQLRVKQILKKTCNVLTNPVKFPTESPKPSTSKKFWKVSGDFFWTWFLLKKTQFFEFFSILLSLRLKERLQCQICCFCWFKDPSHPMVGIKSKPRIKFRNELFPQRFEDTDKPHNQIRKSKVWHASRYWYNTHGQPLWTLKLQSDWN